MLSCFTNGTLIQLISWKTRDEKFPPVVASPQALPPCLRVFNAYKHERNPPPCVTTLDHMSPPPPPPAPLVIANRNKNYLITLMKRKDDRELKESKRKSIKIKKERKVWTMNNIRGWTTKKYFTVEFCPSRQGLPTTHQPPSIIILLLLPFSYIRVT